MKAFLKPFIKKLGFFLLTIIGRSPSCFSVSLYAEIGLETVAAQAPSAGLKLAYRGIEERWIKPCSG
ncbi:MAG: hypothetical protein ACETVU_01460 [Desulfatiglandales bacterium]